MTKAIETKITWYDPKQKLPKNHTKILILTHNIPHGNVIFTMPFAGVQGDYFLEGLGFPAMEIKNIKYWAYPPELIVREE